MLKFVFNFLIIGHLCFVLNLQGAPQNMTQGKDTNTAKRTNMVETQIVARGVRDQKVLDAMRRVPRHLYVPEKMMALAYRDEPLPIGHGQTISQPYIVACMTEALQLTGKEKVLEIGTGSGYQAAVLGEIAKEVYTIEIVEPLAKSAKEILQKQGFTNIHCRFGNGHLGWPEASPFDAIIVTAAPKQIPPKLIEQLAEGGRMIIPVGDFFQELILLQKENGEIKKKQLLPVRFVPMTGEHDQ